MDDLLDLTIEKFWETIPPLWAMVRHHIRATAAERYGLTFEQFHILRHVKKGRRTISQLAEAKNITRPAVSQAVELLVNKRLLMRTQEVDDRRFVTLSLTQAGESLLEAVFSDANTWMKAQLGCPSPEELETVIRSFEILKMVSDKLSGGSNRS